MIATIDRSAAAAKAEPAPAERPWDTAWARLIVSTISLAALVAGLAGLVFDVGPARTVGMAGYLLFGLGAAPWALNRRMGLSLRLTLSGGGSLTALILVSIVMLLGNLWHPAIMATVACVATAPLHVVGILRAKRDLPPWATTPRPTTTPAFVLVLAGAALCLVSALTHRHINPGIWGFLADIGPLWYVGLAFILVALAMARSTDEVTLALGVVLLMLVLTGTPALAYDGPRSQSASKHLEFVQQIRDFHYLRSSIAVYNSWPGYFSAMAWLSDVAGLKDPIGLATAWPVVVGLVRVASMRFLAGQLISGRNLPWIAVGLGVLADPIGADYYSPQSVGFVLGLAIFGIALSTLRLWPKIAAMAAAGSAVTVAHQLSPYIIGGTLCVLVVFRQLRPWWAPATVLGPAAVWAALHWNDLTHFFNFGAVGNASNFRPPATAVTPGLHRLPVVTYTVVALVAGVLLLGAVALVTLVRRRREASAWAVALCPAVGLAIVAVNPYGNEGIFRATLFALPWLAVLAAQAVPKAGSRRVHLPLAGIFLTLAVTFDVAAFGLDATNVLRPPDRAALHVFLEAGDRKQDINYLLILGPGDLPSSPPTLAKTHIAIKRTDLDEDTGFTLTGASATETMQRITADYVTYAKKAAPSVTSHLYAIWSPVSSYYGWEYGIHTRAQFAALREAFSASTSWKPIYSGGGTVLFAYTPPAAAQPGS